MTDCLWMNVVRVVEMNNVANDLLNLLTLV